jgi:hypothetical protein
MFRDMKMVAEYLEHALNFERMAAEEENPQVKATFEKQAADYRRLAAKRAGELGLPEPSKR